MAPNSVQSTSKGWMPGANPVAVPAENFSAGNFGRKAVVLHITEGSLGSALSEFTRTGAQKSAHFVISKTGAIWQCVSVFDTAYANGLSWSGAYWIDPEKHSLKSTPPPWQGLTPPTNPNWQTISIEREGYYQDVPPQAQNDAVVRVLQFVHAQFPTLLPSWAFMQTLIGHCHISPIARANCPGPHVDYAALAAAANVQTQPPPPITKRYRVKHRYVTQRKEDNGPPYVRELVPGEELEIDAWYTNNRAHLASGEGFVDLADLEAV